MNLKLNSLSLPQGGGPIKFNSDFGDTTALMLTGCESAGGSNCNCRARATRLRRCLNACAKERRGKATARQYRWFIATH